MEKGPVMNGVNTLYAQREEEKGAVLIISVLILAALTVIGILATKTAVVETKIATYDKIYKQSWYLTDGTVNMLMLKAIQWGNEDASRPVEFGALDEANEELGGFYLTNYDDDDGNITKAGYLLRKPGETCSANQVDAENPDSNSAQLKNRDGSNVLLKIFSETKPFHGNAQQQNQGYSGIGTSSAAGGAIRDYTIRGLGRVDISAAAGQHKHLTKYNYIIR